MPGIEVQGVSPEEIIHELQESLRLSKENKYAFQVGLKDVEFDVDQEKIAGSGIAFPFANIQLAEQALRLGLIRPTILYEYDDTTHHVITFDPRPVGYSGFMDCVTHSLAMTDLGLFEVGRYPAVSLASPGRYWQWFLHRQLANPEQVTTWQTEHTLTPDQVVERVFQIITARLTFRFGINPLVFLFNFSTPSISYHTHRFAASRICPCAGFGFLLDASGGCEDLQVWKAEPSRINSLKGGENMKLLTKELVKRFAQVGSQETEKDPIILAKFFNPTGAGTWYATEYDPGDRTFFGYVSIFGDWNDEWGSFSLDELESYRGKFGLGIERDLYFGEKQASQVIPRR